MSEDCFKGVTRSVLLLSLSGIVLYGCQDLAVRDTSSLLIPRFRQSEILGFVAGFGTTFAAVPDLVAMLKRRSSAGMNPRMAGIMGVFQIAWIYYGLLILSRPVIAWNTIRGSDRLSERWRVCSFRPQRNETRKRVIQGKRDTVPAAPGQSARC